jgi:hypothetical protein
VISGVISYVLQWRKEDLISGLRMQAVFDRVYQDQGNERANIDRSIRNQRRIHLSCFRLYLSSPKLSEHVTNQARWGLVYLLRSDTARETFFFSEIDLKNLLLRRIWR